MIDYLIIKEITPIINDEGAYTGLPTTCIRLAGCHLECNFCNEEVADETVSQRIYMSKLIKTVRKMGNKHVCITGGEPLLQKEALIPLMYELTYNNFISWIDTSGTVAIEKDIHKRSWNYHMDIKCPSSGVASFNKLDNLGKLQREDEVKFLIADYNDYLYALTVIKQHPTMANIYFSPVFTSQGNNARDLADVMIAENPKGIKLSIPFNRMIGE